MQEPIVERALKKVRGDREKDYGNKWENFGDIADFWTTFLRLKLKPGCRITREDVALMQDLTKTARLMKSPHHEDTRDDKVGYVVCLDDIVNIQQELDKKAKAAEQEASSEQHRTGKGTQDQ